MNVTHKTGMWLSNLEREVSMDRPMFPHAVDSTMMSTFRSCPQKMFRTYIQHWKPAQESVHLVAGGAFAKGIEIARKAFFEHGKGQQESQELGIAALIAAYGDFECPSDSAKSLERTAGALDFYFEQYPLGDDGMNPVRFADGRHGIEFSFAEPLPNIVHPVTGDPILYTGRADMLAEFAGGVYVVDEKTASSLGASWSRQWEMRGQFTGYQWAAGQAGIRTEGAIIRGISILKTKYDTQQAITYRMPWEIERWLAQTERDLERMIACWEAGWWDYDMGEACGSYGGCHLTQVCKTAEPETWLPMRYEKRVWDPLARREMTVEEFEASWEHQVQKNSEAPASSSIARETDGCIQTAGSTATKISSLSGPFQHHHQKPSGAAGMGPDAMSELFKK